MIATGGVQLLNLVVRNKPERLYKQVDCLCLSITRARTIKATKKKRLGRWPTYLPVLTMLYHWFEQEPWICCWV